MEERIKQTQFKQYLENSTASQYDTIKAERPFSRQTQYQDSSIIDLDPVTETPKTVTSSQMKNKSNSQKPLQVNYYGHKPPGSVTADKKGPFNIVKKRKLYNDKQINDF